MAKNTNKDSTKGQEPNCASGALREKIQKKLTKFGRQKASLTAKIGIYGLKQKKKSAPLKNSCLSKGSFCLC